MKIKIKNTLKGRVIDLSNKGTIYVGQNYRLWEYDAQGTKSLIGKVPCPTARRMIEPFRLLCRLFRHEIRGFVILTDGNKIVATRQRLYYAEPNEILLRPASLPQISPTIKPPMMITTDSGGKVLWGEYWGNAERRMVRVFVSEDKGKSYNSLFEFKAGDVKHIHNIIEDPYEQCYWVFVGDHKKEPGIGRLSKDFKSFDWLVKGQQKYRAVNGFIFEDKIIYGTDTEKDFNYIYAIDKATGKTEKLCETPGSCIYAAKFGRWYTLSTSVEYFEKYKNNLATLWASKDALNWHKVYEVEKDIWSKRYFEFGSIVLPQTGWDRDEIVFSGQALKGIDNKVCIAKITVES